MSRATIETGSSTAGSGDTSTDEYPPATRWNIWDLQARPDLIRTAAESWRSLKSGSGGAADDITTAAGKITYWTGDAADSYRTQRGKITGDLDGAAKLAGEAATTLDGVASSLETVQTALDKALLEVTCSYTVDGTTVTFYPTSDADVSSIDTAISDAESARSDLDTHLSESLNKFGTLLTHFTEISNAWAAAANGRPTFELPPDSMLPDGAPEVIRDGDKIIVNTGNGNDEVTVTIDPATGQRILTVNGEQYVVPPGTQLTIRTGAGQDSISVPKGTKVDLTILGSDGNDTVDRPRHHRHRRGQRPGLLRRRQRHRRRRRRQRRGGRGYRQRRGTRRLRAGPDPYRRRHRRGARR